MQARSSLPFLLELVRARISRRGLPACCSIAMVAHAMHGGRNQWVWSLAQSTIKHKILVDQEIKGCLKQDQAIKSKFCRSKILIAVADGSTGYIVVTTPCN